MIENLQRKLRQVERNQSKGAKICANIRWELEDEKYPKTFSKVIKRQSKQTVNFILNYIDVKKQNIPVSTRTFINQLETFWRNLKGHL